MSEVAKSFNFKLAEFGRIGEDCVGEPEKEAGGEGWVVEEAVCRICDVVRVVLTFPVAENGGD